MVSGQDLNGIVIRPSVLYGTSGSLLVGNAFEPALKAAKKGEAFEVVAHPDTRFLTIHQDDLADLYLRLAERVCSLSTPLQGLPNQLLQAPIAKGQAFVGANPQSERYADILDAVVRVSGAKGYKIRPPSDHRVSPVSLVG